MAGFRYFFSLWSVAAAALLSPEARPIEARQDQDLKLQLELRRPQLTWFEPLEIKLKLINDGDSLLIWNKLQYPGAGLEFIISRRGSDPVRRRASEFYWSLPGTKLTRTEPGHAEEFTYLISEHMAERIFATAGQHEIRIELSFDDLSAGSPIPRTLVSPAMPIEIIEPAGRTRAAYDYLKNVLEPAIRGADRDEELRRRQHFSANFADTVYWKYKTFELAGRYLDKHLFQRAEDELYAISDIDFYFDKEVESQLNYLATRLNRPVARSKRSRMPATPPVPILLPVTPKGTVLNPPPANGPVLIPVPVSTPAPISTPR